MKFIFLILFLLLSLTMYSQEKVIFYMVTLDSTYAVTDSVRLDTIAIKKKLTAQDEMVWVVYLQFLEEQQEYLMRHQKKSLNRKFHKQKPRRHRR